MVGEAAPPVGQDHVHAPVPGLVAQSEANAGKVWAREDNRKLYSMRFWESSKFFKNISKAATIQVKGEIQTIPNKLLKNNIEKGMLIISPL